MIKPVCRDQFLLGRKSAPATPEDAATGRDLLDTLQANRERCVGMAANMIGVSKRIIVFSDGRKNVLMYNPVIVRKSGPYETEEGCLSLPGTRKTTRYSEIEVTYEDAAFRKCRGKYSGYIAEIIQHETDHLEGILI